MERLLAHHTWLEVAALDKQDGVVIQAIGAVEQHGPHLPLLTDTLIAQSVTGRMLKHLPEEVPAWLLPTLPISKSTEHSGYAGTLALSAATLGAVLHDVAKSVAEAGFKRLLFVNCHGGNAGLLSMAARDIRAETGLLVFVTMPSLLPEEDFTAFTKEEQRFGIHGGRIETAYLLADHPELVRMERAAPHYPALLSETLQLTAQPTVAWLTRDWSVDGHFGDPTAATAEDGDRWLEHAGERLAKVVAEIAYFDIPVAGPS